MDYPMPDELLISMRSLSMAVTDWRSRWQHRFCTLRAARKQVRARQVQAKEISLGKITRVLGSAQREGARCPISTCGGCITAHRLRNMRRKGFCWRHFRGRSWGRFMTFALRYSMGAGVRRQSTRNEFLRRVVLCDDESVCPLLAKTFGNCKSFSLHRCLKSAGWAFVDSRSKC